MTQEEAIKISERMLDLATDLWESWRSHTNCIKENFLPDFDDLFEANYDYWYGISDEWDLNIWAEDGSKIHASLYPVVNGSTVTDDWIEIDKRD